MVGSRRAEFVRGVLVRLRQIPMWADIPSNHLEIVADWWWDACEKALGQGQHGELSNFVRQIGERLARRGMGLEDFAQLLRIHRDTALAQGWREEQVATVDEIIDDALAHLEGLGPDWALPKGYSYRGTVKLDLPGETAEKERRAKSEAKLPQKVRVRPAVPGENFEEIREILDVSVSGLYFESLRDYGRGTRLFVIFPYDESPGALNREYAAEVVQVDLRPGRLERGIAIRLLHAV